MAKKEKTHLLTGMVVVGKRTINLAKGTARARKKKVKKYGKMLPKLP